MKLVECVPNFSEGRDRSVIDKITAEISGTEKLPQRRGQGPAVSHSVVQRVNERVQSGKRVMIDIHPQRVRPLASPRQS